MARIVLFQAFLAVLLLVAGGYYLLMLSAGGNDGEMVGGSYPFSFLEQEQQMSHATWAPNRERDIRHSKPVPTYIGSGIPIKTDEVCTKESDGQSMFYFKNFHSSPACCPSPYSTDQGCVCAFEKQDPGA